MVTDVDDVDGLRGNQFCDCLGDFLGLGFQGRLETAVCPHTLVSPSRCVCDFRLRTGIELTDPQILAKHRK